MHVFRTAPGPVEAVIEQRLDATAKSMELGRQARQRPPRARRARYLVVVESRDRAADRRHLGAARRATGLPQLHYGRRCPATAASPSATSASQPPLTPLPAGRSAQIGIDARGETYDWSLRRVGGREPSPAAAVA